MHCNFSVIKVSSNLGKRHHLLYLEITRSKISVERLTIIFVVQVSGMEHPYHQSTVVEW